MPVPDHDADEQIVWQGKYITAKTRGRWEYVGRPRNIRAAVIATPSMVAGAMMSSLEATAMTSRMALKTTIQSMVMQATTSYTAIGDTTGCSAA